MLWADDVTQNFYGIQKVYRKVNNYWEEVVAVHKERRIT